MDHNRPISTGSQGNLFGNPQLKRIKPGAFSSVIELARNAPSDLTWAEFLLSIDRCIGGKIVFWQFEVLRREFFDRRPAVAEGRS